MSLHRILILGLRAVEERCTCHGLLHTCQFGTCCASAVPAQDQMLFAWAAENEYSRTARSLAVIGCSKLHRSLIGCCFPKMCKCGKSNDQDAIEKRVEKLEQFFTFYVSSKYHELKYNDISHNQEDNV